MTAVILGVAGLAKPNRCSPGSAWSGGGAKLSGGAILGPGSFAMDFSFGLRPPPPRLVRFDRTGVVKGVSLRSHHEAGSFRVPRPRDG
jgi:hypothetical protein